MAAKALAEIRSLFGVVSLVFRAMDEAGDLDEVWPGIRDFYLDPSPLPREVMDSILAALGLRCRGQYCFVLHSLALVGAGATRIEVEQLAHHLEIPKHVPEHVRWSRVLRLAWLASSPGPQMRSAAHALEMACSPDEHRQVLNACAIGALLTSYVERFNVDVRHEPALELMPEELLALVPEFIAFHTRLRAEDDERPVATACASCQKVRSTTDQTWYPREVSTTLLPKNVLFSHGLCSDCSAQYERDEPT